MEWGHANMFDPACHVFDASNAAVRTCNAIHIYYEVYVRLMLGVLLCLGFSERHLYFGRARTSLAYTSTDEQTAVEQQMICTGVGYTRYVRGLLLLWGYLYTIGPCLGRRDCSCVLVVVGVD